MGTRDAPPTVCCSQGLGSRPLSFSADPAMDSRLFCCLALCVLGTGESSACHVIPLCPPLSHSVCVCIHIHMCVTEIYFFSISVSTDHTKAGVSQSPAHTIIKKGQNVSFRCDPISGHTRLFWYQQKSGQGPEFLIYFQNEVALDKSGLPGDRFSAARPNGSYSVLKIQPAKQEDWAVYLCASSLATAEHSHLLPAHKPQRPLPRHCCPKPQR